MFLERVYILAAALWKQCTGLSVNTLNPISEKRQSLKKKQTPVLTLQRGRGVDSGGRSRNLK